MTEKERELLLEIAHLLTHSEQIRKLFEATGAQSWMFDSLRYKASAVHEEWNTTKANMNTGTF